MKTKILTERLNLREFEVGDEQLLFDLNADWDVVKYTGNPVMKDLQEARQVLKEIIMPQYAAGLGRWAVHLKSDNTFIGWCGLKKLDSDIDLGYRFLKKFWGNGYASESARAVLQYGFETLALNRIIAHAAVENTVSIRVLEKLNLHKTGVGEMDGILVQGFALTRNEWEGGR